MLRCFITARLCEGRVSVSVLKSTIKLCHLSKAHAPLCATVSKPCSIGSSESIGFDLLTAGCLWSAAADFSSGPQPGMYFGFGNKMINNNNPETPERMKVEGCGGLGIKSCLFCSPFLLSSHLYFSILLLSSSFLNPLKIPSLHLRHDALWDVMYKHSPPVYRQTSPTVTYMSFIGQKGTHKVLLTLKIQAKQYFCDIMAADGNLNII